MQLDRSCSVQTSIVVVTFNNRAEIDACLRSLQAHSTDAEIIVVDNLSSDGTLDYVQRQHPHVRAISANRNDGFGAGVNLGARMASGTFLAVVNPDTEVEPGWLQPLIRTLEEQPRVGLVTPTILLKGTEDRVNACGNDVHLTGLAFCRGLNQAAPAQCAPPQTAQCVKVKKTGRLTSIVRCDDRPLRSTHRVQN